MIVYEETRTSRRLLIAMACVCLTFLAMGLLLGSWFFGSFYGTALAVACVGLHALHRRHARPHDIDEAGADVQRLSTKANLWLVLVAACFIVAAGASFLPDVGGRLLLGLPLAAGVLLGRVKAGSAWAELIRTAGRKDK